MLLLHWPSLTAMYETALDTTPFNIDENPFSDTRLRNDLYCVEWDVKL